MELTDKEVEIIQLFTAYILDNKVEFLELTSMKICQDILELYVNYKEGCE